MSAGHIQEHTHINNFYVAEPPTSDSMQYNETALWDLWPTGTEASVTILMAWFITVVFATYMPKNQWMSIFSLKHSWKELTTSRASKLNVLDVFRVVAIVWVMINHTGSEGRIDILERSDSAKVFKDAVHNHPVFGALLGNSALGVEIFLVLSGLLAYCSWIRDANQDFSRHYTSFIVRRVFRLFPSVAAFIFIAAGPIVKTLLPRYHDTMISTCGVSGIVSHLTFLGNWQSTPTCMGYLWYLGLDMQLYIMGPLLMHLLYKRPRFAILTAVLLTSASAIIRAVYCQVYGFCNNSDVDIPFISFPNQTQELLEQTYGGIWETYARPYTKCGPFILGILLGHLIRNVDLSISEKTARRVSFASLAVAVTVIYAILPEYWYPDQGNTLYNTVYTATFRTVFAAAICAWIAALNYQPKIFNLSVYWSALAKLTFNAYLLHMPIVYLFNFSTFLQEATGPYELMAVVPLVAVLSFSAAFIFYCFIESPLGRLSSSMCKQLGL
ncbi:hypothetical protein QR680_000621 [Steinernema hermaphroditum]|uniref:Acyltransferase 3 domain-containing protein n=1 Tax=Steinernema hermaphroditum TaxID=289476 RepID=A0AA39GW38_9BILA|nr:hypothetical protein QR680_000621 [Steinernema hermaphroditum]